ncbi:MAG TPA: hypothetical protein GXZ52_07675 [Clostridiales bacterium]|nr:hypothetical protein [Clostridiales bacterium]
MVLRKLLHRILNMCNPAWGALKGTLMLCCAMVFCAFIILVEIGPVSIDTYHLYLYAKELATAPAGLLLIAAIGTVCIEEQAE